MFLWLLCLLSATSSVLSDQDSPSTQLQRVWWSPVAPPSDLRGMSVLEGDILRFDFLENSRNAIKPKQFQWDKGVVPYEFGSGFSESDKNRITESMKLIESKTCVRFVPKKSEKNFIRFQSGKGGCYSSVGRYPSFNGPRPVNLQVPQCTEHRQLIDHELLHVVGLFHEQSRPDRDNYVDIHWDNIDQKYKSDFAKGTAQGMNTFGVPYDYDSILHYSNYAFSKNGKPTITAKGNPSKKLGQNTSPSEGDFEKIRKIYNCK